VGGKILNDEMWEIYDFSRKKEAAWGGDRGGIPVDCAQHFTGEKRIDNN